jgi:hypothetical protein
MIWWIFLLIASPAILYGLHRYCLYLEDRGYLYYRRKKPPAGGGSVFNPLQEIIQPQIRHVLEIKDELPLKSEDDRGDPERLRPFSRKSSR